MPPTRVTGSPTSIVPLVILIQVELPQEVEEILQNAAEPPLNPSLEWLLSRVSELGYIGDVSRSANKLFKTIV